MCATCQNILQQLSSWSPYANHDIPPINAIANQYRWSEQFRHGPGRLMRKEKSLSNVIDDNKYPGAKILNQFHSSSIEKKGLYMKSKLSNYSELAITP